MTPGNVRLIRNVAALPYAPDYATGQILHRMLLDEAAAGDHRRRSNCGGGHCPIPLRRGLTDTGSDRSRCVTQAATHPLVLTGAWRFPLVDTPNGEVRVFESHIKC